MATTRPQAAPGPRITLLPQHEISKQAKRLKRRLAALALTCAEATRVSETCSTTEADIQGDFAQVLCSIAMLISPEVYRELFGEYPQIQD